MTDNNEHWHCDGTTTLLTLMTKKELLTRCIKLTHAISVEQHVDGLTVALMCVVLAYR